MLINVYTDGSAPPSTVALAAERFGGCIYVVDPADRKVERMLPVLHELGPVIATTDPQEVHAAMGLRNPCGVVTFAESTLELASRFARHFGLPGQTAETARWLTNKSAQREVLNSRGVGQVRSVPVIDGHVPVGAPFPAVVKPQHGAGSENTVIVNNLDEFAAYANQLPQDCDYVIEELIRGASNPLGCWLADYLSVESAVDIHGQVLHLGVTGRLPLAEPVRETGLVFPVTLPSGLEEGVLRLTDAGIRALEIRASLVHTEIKLTDGGPVIIEVNGRLGGGLHRLMPRVGVVEPVALAVALAVGEDVPTVLGRPDRHALHLYVQPPVDAVALRELPEPVSLRSQPGVFGADRIRRPGDPVDWRGGSAGRVYDVWIEGDTMDDLEHHARAVIEGLERTISWKYDGSAPDPSAVHYAAQVNFGGIVLG